MPIKSFFIIITLLMLPCSVFSQSDVRDSARLVLTSGLRGDFSTTIAQQESHDSMVLLMQSILDQNKKNDALYLDLGNSFYPGLLSRYSFGSVMLDYFVQTGCVATLISSDDLKIGFDNLQFLHESGGDFLISSNINSEGTPPFQTYVPVLINDKKVVFIGLTTDDATFDIAEKKTYNLSIEDAEKTLSRLLPELKNSGSEYIIVLSGLDFSGNLDLMHKFGDISMIISGGDNQGYLFDSPVSRVDLKDGRSIVSLSGERKGYYTLDVSLDTLIHVENVDFHKPESVETAAPGYDEFLERIALWKRQFKSEYALPVADIGDRTLTLNVESAGNLMRDIFNAEVAILDKGSISDAEFTGKIRGENLLEAIDDEYFIFSYKMTGSDLLSASSKETMFFSGLTDGKIQGYPVKNNHMYKVVSTQPVYEEITGFQAEPPEFKNKWRNIGNLFEEDLIEEQKALKKDFAYLDNRFRAHIDIHLSYFRESSEVNVDENVNVPPGRPAESFSKVGTENKMDLTVYNRWHRFIFTPYIYYVKQDDTYLHNLLRFSLLYNLNLGYMISPYNKLQYDTLLVEVDGLRPAVLRETAGALIEYGNFSGRLGAGFEKEVRDPSGPFVYGLELWMKYSIDFMDHFRYTLEFDSFATKNRKADEPEDEGYIRTTIENRLGVRVQRTLWLNFSHKWFNYHSIGYGENYTHTQLIVSINFKTDFKVW